MFLMITTAIAVFVGLFKAAAVLLGAVIGVGLFAAVVGLLFAVLLRELIDSIVRNWSAKGDVPDSVERIV